MSNGVKKILKEATSAVVASHVPSSRKNLNQQSPYNMQDSSGMPGFPNNQPRGGDSQQGKSKNRSQQQNPYNMQGGNLGVPRSSSYSQQRQRSLLMLLAPFAVELVKVVLPSVRKALFRFRQQLAPVVLLGIAAIGGAVVSNEGFGRGFVVSLVAGLVAVWRMRRPLLDRPRVRRDFAVCVGAATLWCWATALFGFGHTGTIGVVVWAVLAIAWWRRHGVRRTDGSDGSAAHAPKPFPGGLPDGPSMLRTALERPAAAPAGTSLLPAAPGSPERTEVVEGGDAGSSERPAELTRAPIPPEQLAAAATEIGTAWAELQDKRPNLKHVKMVDAVPFDDGVTGTLLMDRGRLHIGTVQGELPYISSGLEYPLQSLLLEQHPNYTLSNSNLLNPNYLRLQVMARSPIEETVYFRRPKVVNGRIHYGLYADGRDSSSMRLYTTDSMYGGFILGSQGSGKALDINTPVATPDGWSRMGSLHPGDKIFDDIGDVCTVLATSEIMYNRPCYEIEFSDGEKIVADADHQWWTETWISRKRIVGSVKTTLEIADSLALIHRINNLCIVDVRRVESRPVRCVQVDSPSSLFLAGRGMVPTHNSRLVELIVLSALSLRNTVILYIDGQDGASSPILYNNLWSGGPAEAEEFLAGIGRVMEYRNRYNRAHRNEGFTPSPEYPGILVVVEEAHGIYNEQNAARHGKVVREGRKLGVAELANSQYAGLQSTFGNLAPLRDCLLASNTIVLRTTSKSSNQMIPNLGLNPGELPLLPGYGVVAAPPDDPHSRSAPFRALYIPKQRDRDDPDRSVDMTVPTLEEWFARAQDEKWEPELDAGSARAFGPLYTDRHAIAARREAALLAELDGRPALSSSTTLTLPASSGSFGREPSGEQGTMADALMALPWDRYNGEMRRTQMFELLPGANPSTVASALRSLCGGSSPLLEAVGDGVYRKMVS